MKKTIQMVFAGILSGAMLLSGCGSQVVPPQTDPTDPPQIVETEPGQTEMVPVDESVFFFSNELELARLYSIRKDGSDLKLVADINSYEVHRAGNRVFYLNGQNLCFYDIETGGTQILIEDVFDYRIDGDDLIYFRDLKEAFQTSLGYYNLRTGEDVEIESLMFSGSRAVKNGKAYYTRYNVDIDKTQLCVCDLATLEIDTIADEFESCYELIPTHDGVFFEGLDEYYQSGYYYVSSDGSNLAPVEVGITENCDVFAAFDGSFLCVHSTYDIHLGSQSCIHRHDSDGSVTELLWGEPGGYFIVEDAGNGQWLVKYTTYDSWGPEDEYGYRENFVYRVDYVLLDQMGNATPIDVTGENGKMFADGDFPILDSSTARKPVTAALYNLFVANYGYEGAQPICSTTHGAWLNIADRKVDIALLAAPTEEELAYLEVRGVEIEMKLYGGDGLVFIGNAANPVTNLNHDQIIGIYQGKITNWREVGGPDHPITVYYRDDQSGSQRLFESLVFKGLGVPDFETMEFGIMDEMSSIVNIILEDPYSIGYSIMTYLDEVYAEEDLQVFAVNGVAPSVDTIKDSSYPYHTQGYVVIRSDEPEDSPARRLFNWFGCPVSKDLLTQCSITPLEDGVG